ncbi:MAG: 30S ribosomal protein S19e [Candidatus Thermoplasmatota archaeon]|jgi:small subunit ribosomal protein S19e|nr:30S ribosomal protein S19e [Candidatus Thermoplasmatota archaeon]MCL5786308.1 30S ribosomal protein S19e [Candidatus Thermoplasmatota archaeon]
MVDARNIPSDALINGLSAKFKEDSRIVPPPWVNYLKAGIHREKPWTQDDWYQVRLASTLRKISIYGPVGISKLSSYYGGKVDKGSAGYHPGKGSRFLVRHMFQVLESLGYVKKDKSGRTISPEGRSLLDKTAKEVLEKMSKEDSSLKKLL